MAPLTVLRTIRPRGRTPAQLGYFVARLGLLPLVRWHRRRFRETTVVGITGSAGKSTTTRLLESMLSTLGVTCSSRGSKNTAKALVDTAWRIPHNCRFLVHELAAWAPGTMRELAWALEPAVAIVTSVGWDHYRAFRGPDGAAREKAELVRALPHDGLVVLNSDDHRVRAMASATSARAVFYGVASDADYRAVGVGAAWPDRLSFELIHPAGRTAVSTRLIGRHWVTSVLAALAGALELGVAADDAARLLAAVEPVPARLEAIDGGGGVTFLLDNFKAPVWTVWPALDVLGEARAGRRIAIIGQLSDDPRKPREIYRRVIEYARARAELVLVTGRWAETAVRRVDDPAVRGFASVNDLGRFLQAELREGDLILVKGTDSSDHSGRIIETTRRLTRR